jgi:hypothetical protein
MGEKKESQLGLNAIFICGFLWWLYCSALAFVKLAVSNLKTNKFWVHYRYCRSRGRFRARHRSRSEARCCCNSLGLGKGWILKEALGDDAHDQLQSSNVQPLGIKHRLGFRCIPSHDASPTRRYRREHQQW